MILPPHNLFGEPTPGLVSSKSGAGAGSAAQPAGTILETEVGAELQTEDNKYIATE